MNHREPPHAPGRLGWAGLRLVLLTLLAVTPLCVQAQSRRAHLGLAVGRAAEPMPYLVAAGAPPLRFAPAPLPPEPAPTAPAASSTSSATKTDPASKTTPDFISPLVPEPVAAASKPAELPNETTETTDAAKPAVKTPPPILADDVRPAVRPEDFLPFFQVPGSARRPGTLNVVVPVPPAPPAPGILPPSSATYTQTPK